MRNYDDYTVDGGALKSGWIMVLLVNLGLVILTL